MRADTAADDTEAVTAEAVVEDLPPSAAHVLYVLEREGSLTPAALASTSYLSKSTARRAVGRLQDIGIVEARRAPGDARRRIYELTTPPAE